MAKKVAKTTIRSGKQGKNRIAKPKRRIGSLTPGEFEAAASSALGGRGWQKTFTAGTGLAQSTLTRYLRGVFPVPQHIAVLVEMLQTLRSHGLPLPESFDRFKP